MLLIDSSLAFWWKRGLLSRGFTILRVFLVSDDSDNRSNEQHALEGILSDGEFQEKAASLSCLPQGARGLKLMEPFDNLE